MRFGLIGNLFLLFVYLLLIGRGLMIAASAPLLVAGKIEDVAESILAQANAVS